MQQMPFYLSVYTVFIYFLYIDYLEIQTHDSLCIHILLESKILSFLVDWVLDRIECYKRGRFLLGCPRVEILRGSFFILLQTSGLIIHMTIA